MRGLYGLVLVDASTLKKTRGYKPVITRGYISEREAWDLLMLEGRAVEPVRSGQDATHSLVVYELEESDPEVESKYEKRVSVTAPWIRRKAVGIAGEFAFIDYAREVKI